MVTSVQLYQHSTQEETRKYPGSTHRYLTTELKWSGNQTMYAIIPTAFLFPYLMEHQILPTKLVNLMSSNTLTLTSKGTLEAQEAYNFWQQDRTMMQT